MAAGCFRRLAHHLHRCSALPMAVLPRRWRPCSTAARCASRRERRPGWLRRGPQHRRRQPIALARLAPFQPISGSPAPQARETDWELDSEQHQGLRSNRPWSDAVT
jgi:hypothetical protein